jgi:hypothetical protein
VRDRGDGGDGRVGVQAQVENGARVGEVEELGDKLERPEVAARPAVGGISRPVLLSSIQFSMFALFCAKLGTHFLHAPLVHPLEPKHVNVDAGGARHVQVRLNRLALARREEQRDVPAVVLTLEQA